MLLSGGALIRDLPVHAFGRTKMRNMPYLYDVVYTLTIGIHRRRAPLIFQDE